MGVELYQRCNSYLDSRKGTYEFRCQRYLAVYVKLHRMGLEQGDLVVDVGAGRCEFAHYLHEVGERVRYVPVDGSIDGTDLNYWTAPNLRPAFFVAIETLEHLQNPLRLAKIMQRRASKGVVITTPNPLTTDVLAIDSTHLTPIHYNEIKKWDGQGRWRVEFRSLFGRPEDTILAWRRS